MTEERGEAVLRGQLHHLLAMEDGQSIAREDDPTDPLGSHTGEDGFKLIGALHHDRGGKRDVQGPGGILHLLEEPGGTGRLATTAMRFTESTAWPSSSTYFSPIPVALKARPVTFPPGRARLSMNPASTGSSTTTMTMGIVRVAWRAA